MTVGPVNSWDQFTVDGSITNVTWPTGRGGSADALAGSPPPLALTKPGTLVLIGSIIGNEIVPGGASIRDGTGNAILFDVAFSTVQREYVFGGIELWNGLSAVAFGTAQGAFTIEYRVIRQVR